VNVPAETIAATSAETLAFEYEELRRVALGGSGGHGGAGYASFLRRGMAAWMDAA